MKLKKTIAAVVIGSFLAVGLAFAAEGKKEAKVAGCCAKASKDGKACTHECCVTASKAGKNCEKCGGAGEAKKAEAKK
jgi:predicted nucleic acid binding AN1-type Zn finger protein